jgi:hypothetical protein
MKTIITITKDFFRVSFITWLVLVFLELINAGMVQRFINLEIYFYFLILIYIFNKVIDR